MALLSSSRRTLHRSVWVPGGREEPFFPLSTLGKARAQSAATAETVPAAGERENWHSALSHSPAVGEAHCPAAHDRCTSQKY